MQFSKTKQGADIIAMNNEMCYVIYIKYLRGRYN